MATVEIRSEHEAPRVAVLSEPDEDGEYDWTCRTCGASGGSFQPLADAIMNADVHVDIQCPGGHA